MATEAVLVDNLNFSYGGPPILRDVSFSLPRGSRCLLVGANGAGKTSLLRILAGKRLVKGKVMVLGHKAYEDTPQSITYLGPEWAANPVVRTDVSVENLLNSMDAHKYPARRDHLLDILDINVNWHTHQISDGERRRVQIMMGLIEPFEMLLLDEVTVDLDVLVRRNLLQFLREESEKNGVTIVYATHIYDGLGDWPSHLVHIRAGSIVTSGRFTDFHAEMQAAQEGKSKMDSPLLVLVEKWLANDRVVVRQSRKDLSLLPNVWERLSEDMKTHGDKYYNYWN